MEGDRAAQNLTVVENHFHSEALNEVEAALETFTTISFGRRLRQMVSIGPSPEKKLWQRIIVNYLRRCVM